jgi:hypothetical protein
VWAARRKLVKLFKKQKSKFHWYDFTVRGRHYRIPRLRFVAGGVLVLRERLLKFLKASMAMRILCPTPFG